MRRREFLGAIGGATALPFSSGAQPKSASPVIGWHIAAFLTGLRETGFIEGSNVALEYRWAEDRLERLPALANELVQRRVTIILANAPPAAVAAKAATPTIPIVFVVGFDPVAAGLVRSFNNPGGNLTGVSLYTGGLVAKKWRFLQS